MSFWRSWITENIRDKSVRRANITILLIVFSLVSLPLVLDRLILNKPSPRISRSLDTSSAGVEIEWLHRLPDSDRLITMAGEGDSLVLAAQPAASRFEDNLTRLDATTGGPIWTSDLSGNQWAVVSVVLGGDHVYTFSSTGVNAYEMSTGEWLWFSEFEASPSHRGGAIAVPQLDESVLRAYFRLRLYEFSPADGTALLFNAPRDQLHWTVNGIGLYQDGSDSLRAVAEASREEMWRRHIPLFEAQDQRWPPLPAPDGDLLVKLSTTQYSGICLLSLEEGEYQWCRREHYLSNVALDREQAIVFALRDDFTLVGFDLGTGRILTEVKFLPSPLPQEMANYGYYYYVGVVGPTVVVGFGDSQEIFALRLK